LAAKPSELVPPELLESEPEPEAEPDAEKRENLKETNSIEKTLFNVSSN
jgi:hypothetical protein